MDCKLLWQSPRNGTHYDPRDTINMGWSVRNIGNVDWDTSSVTFVYVSGSRLQRDDTVHLPGVVSAGQEVVLTAPLRVPAKARGPYATVWALRRGNDFFCPLSITIIVP